MRIEIEAGEIKEERSLLEFREFLIEDAAVLGQHGPGLIQIFTVVENARRERFCVFGNPLSVKVSCFVREITRVGLRS